MTERPVIFNGEMVRAILAGRKTQTRRIMKPQPEAMPDKPGEYWWPAKRFESMLQLSYFNDPVAKELAADACPFGGIGDRLWVKETFAPGLCTKSAIAYRATHKPSDLDEGWDEQIKWTPSIHMSRSFSRINLEITDVRVERLNDINEQDALAVDVMNSRPIEIYRQYVFALILIYLFTLTVHLYLRTFLPINGNRRAL